MDCSSFLAIFSASSSCFLSDSNLSFACSLFCLPSSKIFLLTLVSAKVMFFSFISVCIVKFFSTKAGVLVVSFLFLVFEKNKKVPKIKAISKVVIIKRPSFLCDNNFKRLFLFFFSYSS